MKILIDIMGWAGAFLILLAYFLISTHRIKSNNRLYQVLNIGGSLLLVVNTIYYHTYPIAMLNAIWLSIGITMLIRIYRDERS
jgi:drug/metabolite transporter (DMT)-like permease